MRPPPGANRWSATKPTDGRPDRRRRPRRPGFSVQRCLRRGLRRAPGPFIAVCRSVRPSILFSGARIRPRRACGRPRLSVAGQAEGRRYGNGGVARGRADAVCATQSDGGWPPPAMAVSCGRSSGAGGPTPGRGRGSAVRCLEQRSPATLRGAMMGCGRAPVWDGLDVVLRHRALDAAVDAAGTGL